MGKIFSQPGISNDVGGVESSGGEAPEITQLRILPEVSGDIVRAGQWYNQKSPGLGLEFAEAVYRFIDEIVGTPTTRQKFFGEFRRGLMPRFPYAVYYRIGTSELMIALVFHTARNPNAVRRLLRKRGM